MAEPGEMDELRARPRRVEQDAAAARIPAGGADRDVGEIRTELREFRAQNNAVLNAMRDDLVDLRERMDEGFAQIAEKFAQVDRKFTQVDQNFLTVTGKIDGVVAGLQVITDLLTRERDDRPEG